MDDENLGREFEKLTLLDKWRLESVFWRDRYRELELDLKRYKMVDRHSFEKSCKMEELLSSVDEIAEETCDHGNLAGVRKLVELYRALKARGDCETQESEG